MPAKDEVTEFYRLLAAASQVDRWRATEGVMLWALGRIEESTETLVREVKAVALAKEKDADGD